MKLYVVIDNINNKEPVVLLTINTYVAWFLTVLNNKAVITAIMIYQLITSLSTHFIFARNYIVHLVHNKMFSDYRHGNVLLDYFGGSYIFLTFVGL